MLSKRHLVVIVSATILITFAALLAWFNVAGCKSYGLIESAGIARAGVAHYELAEFEWLTQQSRKAAIAVAEAFCDGPIVVNIEMEKKHTVYNEHRTGGRLIKIPIEITTIYLAFSCQ